MSDWQLEIGLYPGILLGVRTYENTNNTTEHVVYFPFVEFILTIYKEKDEHTDES